MNSWIHHMGTLGGFPVAVLNALMYETAR